MTIEQTVAQMVVEDYYGLNIKKNTRQYPYPEARAIYYKIIKNNTSLPFEKIAKPMQKDHSTVVYFCNKVEDWKQTDKEFQAKFNLIEAAFKKVLSIKPTMLSAEWLEDFAKENDKSLKEIINFQQEKFDAQKKIISGLREKISRLTTQRNKFKELYNQCNDKKS